jgi:hypothetical protein
VPQDHWEEYGNLSDGVLIRVKQEWFERNAISMTGYNDKMTMNLKCIADSNGLEAIREEKECNRVF